MLHTMTNETTTMVTPEVETHRTCTTCGEVKELHLFEVYKNRRGGYSNRCKRCKTQANDRATVLYNRLKSRASADNMPFVVVKKELDKLYNFFSGHCSYCGAEEVNSARTFHVDHVTPTSLGGSHSADNLILACAACNHAKYNKPLLTFYRESETFSAVSLNLITNYLAAVGDTSPAAILAEQVAVQAASDFQALEVPFNEAVLMKEILDELQTRNTFVTQGGVSQ